MLNLPKAPLKLGGAAVALVGDRLTDVTDGAVSMLRRPKNLGKGGFLSVRISIKTKGLQGLGEL